MNNTLNEFYSEKQIEWINKKKHQWLLQLIIVNIHWALSNENFVLYMNYLISILKKKFLYGRYYSYYHHLKWGTACIGNLPKVT